jgi:hypothetical protein
MRFVSLAFISTALLFAACGGDDSDSESYPTFQGCFDDHHNVESLTVTESISVCCLEHPIGSSAAGIVCGADATSCGTYVTANLAGTSATAAEITAGCMDYQTQKGM